MADTILLTGGTGFLGTWTAVRLVRLSPDVMKTLYVLVRASGEEEAFHRLRTAWQEDPELLAALGTRVIPVTGDFTEERLGLDNDIYNPLRDDVTLIIHSGAEIGFQKSAQELDAVNVRGTRNMLSFAADCKKLRRFVHISTAYVAGLKKGLVTESEPAGEAFSSLYEESKAKAEALVRAAGLPFSICRPGMIAGDSRTGRVKSFNTVYYVLKLLLLGELPALPIRQDMALNLIPVDFVADSVVKICLSEEAEGKTFHLTCPKETALRAGELVNYARAWAMVNLNVDLPKPVFIPLPALKNAGLLYNKKEDDRKKNFVTNLLTLLPYFFAEQEFDRTNTDRIAGTFFLSRKDYLDTLLEYACRKNFMRQTGRTVFLQARERRNSTRYPITYYDITEKGIYRITGPEANEKIDRIVNALWGLGVRKGSRVALTGINSVTYMMLEQAIGLLGAVSVPIYYTTPAAETSMLLEKSGAGWFFIGDKRMMEQADEIKTSAVMIAFSAARAIAEPGLMRWGEFLKLGTEPAPPQYPDPDDLATIRYTSGTTGDPKGVMFSFKQLAWMGETLASLLPWKDRNRSLRYLSFLPLSHVVEGVLTANAPYYTLAKVDFYYLNDFGALSDTLPKVRPNIFFSVPRFYEKLWEKMMESAPGKAWLAAKSGPAKENLAAAVRRVALRKAGLDACKQLIVGSAPMSEMLLRNFRALGIEIHNAYGQTEAPLISLNRLGDNVIPSIGTPLPDTEVSLAEDGELIVSGPQVTSGYYGLESESIRDGILKTGDLGTILENGHIILYGRKKDMLITAYGKNISIPKIEEKLKDIPGVSEAVLIGEGKPYCTALLWLEGKVPNLKARIREINESLSRPEQIKDYRIISRPLTIQKGELTPNLKVKRTAVAEHFARIIKEMYQ